MHGPLYTFLEMDHRRLDALLDAAVVDPLRFDHAAFEDFRAGLLRHIGIEEKILLKDARQRRGGEPLPVARQLRLEHGALTSLLVPTPDAALVVEIRSILAQHNPLEEDPGGIYDTCEQLAGDHVAELMARANAAPQVPLNPHNDMPGTKRTAHEALEAMRRWAERSPPGQ